MHPYHLCVISGPRRCICVWRLSDDSACKILVSSGFLMFWTQLYKKLTAVRRCICFYEHVLVPSPCVFGFCSLVCVMFGIVCSVCLLKKHQNACQHPARKEINFIGQSQQPLKVRTHELKYFVDVPFD